MTRQDEKPEKKAKKLMVSKKLWQTIEGYYADARKAKTEKKPVAWCSFRAPTEILAAMDITCVFPEAHSATCGGRKVSSYHCQVAESRGYPLQLCSYCKNDLGYVLAGSENKSPIGGLPDPDLMVACTNSCGVITKWFEIQSRHFKVPYFLVEVPLKHHEPDKDAIAYIQKQFTELIRFLEGFLKKRFDYDYLKSLVDTAQRSSILWQRVVESNKKIPAPVTMVDLWAHNFIVLAMRTQEKAVDYYKELKDEVDGRIANGVGALDEEKYRLYWDNIVLWFGLRWLGNFDTLGANIVASTYTDLFSYFFLDSSRPLESIAEDCYYLYMNQTVEKKIERVRSIAEDYAIDGLIWHFTKTCKAFTMDQIMEKGEIDRLTGLPSIMLQGDMTDERFFSESQANTLMEALFETIDQRKKHT